MMKEGKNQLMITKRWLFGCAMVLSFLMTTPVRADTIYRIAFSGGDISSLDPALTSEPIAIQLVEELTVGLLRQNEVTGELEPGMALDYHFSDDQRMVIFQLRRDVPWVRFNQDSGEVEPVLDCDGHIRYVRADDFRMGIKRTLAPENGSPYAFLINQVIQGASAYNSGETADFSTVGVTAIDDQTLSIKLNDMGVYNLNKLSLWVVRAAPSWLITGDACTEAQNDRWTEDGNYQEYGPFVLQGWIHGDRLTLVQNPFFPASDSIPTPQIDGVEVRMMGEAQAIAAYEIGELDSVMIPPGDYDRVLADPAFQNQLIEKPFNVGTEALLFNIHLPPTDDVRVRRALSLAIDRQAVVQAVKSGTPAYFWIHHGVNGAPDSADFPNFSARYDLVEAQRLIHEYCTEKGIAPDDISISYLFSTSDLHRVRAEVIAHMWEAGLGIHVLLKNSEWAVFNDIRKEGLENVYRTAWIQDYLDANNFTADVFLCPGGYYQASTDWPSEGCDLSGGDVDPDYLRYQSLVLQAGREQDSAKRKALYAEADGILIRDAALLAPLSWNDAVTLRQTRVQMPISQIGYERWEKMRIAE